ncbi:MAG TPA: acyl carrier protein [Alphaproteobacteria bacterium]|jgi:acyl carrier protein
MSPEAAERLEEIFRIIFDVEAARDVASVDKKTEPRWDSLAHTSLVAAVEGEFGLTLDIADMEAMTSYAAVRKFLEEKNV